MRNAPPAMLAAAIGLAALIACSPQPSAGSGAETNARIESLQTRVAALEIEQLAATKPHETTGPMVYFVNLKDGATVTSPVRVVFGLSGMGVAPALIEKENTGHHHLLVDAEIPAEEMEFAIPNDAQHIHFGGGQTETVVELSPGQHTLKLVFADLNHTPFNPSIESETITINVQ